MFRRFFESEFRKLIIIDDDHSTAVVSLRFEVAVDLPGHGASDPSVADPADAVSAKLVIRVLRPFGASEG